MPNCIYPLNNNLQNGTLHSFDNILLSKAALCLYMKLCNTSVCTKCDTMETPQYIFDLRMLTMIMPTDNDEEKDEDDDNDADDDDNDDDNALS